MKRIFLGVVATALIASCSAGFLGYWIVRDRLTKAFEKHYESTQSNLAETLILLEADSDRIAMNAVQAFRLMERLKGFPAESEFQRLQASYSVANFFATDSKGNYIFSTNGFTLENGQLQNKNLFKICPYYKNILKGNRVEQTPIIWNDYEKNLNDSYKYTMIANYNRTRVLEVGVSVKPIINRLWSVFHSDNEIERLTLFAASGKVLVAFPPESEVLAKAPELEYFKKNIRSFNYRKWTRNGLLLMTRINPPTNGGKCHECKDRGLTHNGEYYYILSVFVSAQELAKNLNIAAVSFLLIVFLALIAAIYSSKYIAKVTELSETEAKAEAEKDRALALQGKSVFHDVQNPLQFLKLQVDQSNAGDDEKAEMRHTINRVDDTLNSLRIKHGHDSTQKSHLLVSLIKPIVSQARRLAEKTPEIRISFKYDSSAYYLFSMLESGRLQRVLSNIVSNSVHAVTPKGNIDIELGSADPNRVCIFIKDDGKGIPSHILPYIYGQGFSYDKEGGSGIGLYLARKEIERWNGEIVTESEVQVGTTTRIYLPRSTPPRWFVEKIVITSNQKLVVIDDDDYLYNVFVKTLKDLGLQNQLIGFRSYTSFSDWFTKINRDDANTLYFIDLNLGGLYDGLDLICHHQIRRNVFLVTHRWDEEETYERCLKMGIGLVPKGLVHILPIEVSQEGPVESSGDENRSDTRKYDAIVIDDESAILKLLEKRARQEGKTIRTFSSVAAFIDESDLILSDTDICIDSNLGLEATGEEQAEMIAARGFHRIYSMSADESISLEEFPWIKGRRKKTQPWKTYIEFGRDQL